MRWAATIPSKFDLHAERSLSLTEHRRFLDLCEIGDRVALHLHAKPDQKRAEEALKELIATGHDIENDGSVFDCCDCWQTAKEYKRGGQVTAKKKVRTPEV